MTLQYIGGPKDGEAYAVPAGMTAPPEIRLMGKGVYVLTTPNPKSLTQFIPFLQWRGKE